MLTFLLSGLRKRLRLLFILQLQLAKGPEKRGKESRQAKEEFAYCREVCSVADTRDASRLPSTSSLVICVFPCLPASDRPGEGLLVLLRRSTSETGPCSLSAVPIHDIRAASQRSQELNAFYGWLFGSRLPSTANCFSQQLPSAIC